MGNLSSTPSSSTTTNTDGEQYDVFLSFRGEDTRRVFTSHLYQALHEKQIKTFMDDQLERGEEIFEGLWTTIRGSKISVVIFSKNYASSICCLRELAEIMKCREKKKQIVIPVFYEVDPSHVRKQSGTYEAAFAKHDNELQQDEVKKWRQDLTEASGISGFDSSNARDDAEFVCDIVKCVWNELKNIWPSCDFKHLVGIEKHIERIESLLCLGVPGFRIIGIWGMGGMGKSSIADAVFHRVSHQFDKTYFARCAGVESENDLIRLREEIHSELLNEEKLKIGSPSIPQPFKRRLNQKNVLIVVDDVDKLANFEILAGGLDRFGPKSRIILTARDKQVFHDCGVEYHNMYKVEGLNDDDALQLFCKHAFKQNHPTKDFEVLSREVVKIATNLPLAVRVLGSLLYTKSSKREWENAVDKFKRIVNPKIVDVLRISYDGLDVEEKGLFLDIACFVEFKFKIDKESFAPNLSSDRELSLSRLIDKLLVTIEGGSIKMHDLLRQMGREIVDEESPYKPGDRSRLWREEDVLHTLKHNDGTNAVRGIFLSMFNLKDVCLSFQALTKMYNLRILIITHGEVHLRNGGLDYLPDKISYLHCEKFPLEVLPLSLNLENLVELDLSHSQIKQFLEGRMCLSKLKWLKLDYCENLISIPDLSNIPLAEIINLKHCISLLEIHSSGKPPKNLHSLHLSSCRNLNRFPSNIHIEGSEFSLSGCISLTKFPVISGNIKKLDLSGSGVEEVPSMIQNLSKLESLDMSNCRMLKSISNSICKLKSLVLLKLSGCCSLESFPNIFEGMKLKYLDLSGTAIKELPLSTGNLNRLEQLVLSDCKNLETFPEDIGCLSSLEKLELHGNVFERLSNSIKQLSKLYYLGISHCGELRSIPELPLSLRYLEAMNCKQLIQSLPDEFFFCSQSFGFNFINCLNLNQEAVNNLLIIFQVSVQKMRLMGTEKIISLFERDERKEVEGSICLPGSEIPEWFCYKNNGSSLNIPGLRNDCDRSRYIMGFEVCLVIGFENYNIDCEDYLNVHYDIHIETSDGEKEGFSGEQFLGCDVPIEDYGFIDSDHILLGCILSSKCYELFQKLDTLKNRSMSDYVGTSFAFKCYGDCHKVKHCGIKPIYV